MLVRPKMATVYGCVAIVARSQGYVSNLQLQLELSQSRSQVEQLCTRLVQIGIFYSNRGPGGGYVLTRPPEEISLSEIHRTFDGYDKSSVIARFIDEYLQQCSVRDLLSVDALEQIA